MSIETFYSKQEFMKKPIIKALLDLNIAHKSKYYDFFYIEHKFYGKILEEYINKKKD